jgi:hypothetical protein
MSAAGAAEFRTEWADVPRDLDRLHEIEFNKDGRQIVMRPIDIPCAWRSSREQRGLAPPVAVTLPAHVRSRDVPVQPHRLDSYAG